jgi:hypothetical protein
VKLGPAIKTGIDAVVTGGSPSNRTLLFGAMGDAIETYGRVADLAALAALPDPTNLWPYRVLNDGTGYARLYLDDAASVAAAGPPWVVVPTAPGIAGRYIASSVSLAEHDWWLTNGYDDLSFSAVPVNPTGAVAAPAYNDVESTLDFQNGASNRVDYNYQWRHAIQLGSDAYYHIHATFHSGGGGNTRWTLAWRVWEVGAAKPAWTTDTIIIAAPGNTNHVHLPVKTFAAVGGLSTAVQVQLTRTGGHVDDTHVGDVGMLFSDMHVLIDRPQGSRTLTTK